jgi:hypothetical protein
MPPCHGGDRRFESGRARHCNYCYLWQSITIILAGWSFLRHADVVIRIPFTKIWVSWYIPPVTLAGL